MEIQIEHLTEEAFQLFGTFIQQPSRPVDARGQGWTWWGENALLPASSRPYGIGYLDLIPAELCFDWAERHMHSQEMIIPTGEACLVYVAPADYLEEPDRLPAIDRFKVFRVEAGQAVILKEGVWHGAPLALNKPSKTIV